MRGLPRNHRGDTLLRWYVTHHLGRPGDSAELVNMTTNLEHGAAVVALPGLDERVASTSFDFRGTKFAQASKQAGSEKVSGNFSARFGWYPLLCVVVL